MSTGEASRGSGYRPPKPLELGSDKLPAWRIFKRRWANYTLLSGLSKKDRDYQVAAIENCLGDDAMTLYEGFTFDTDDDSRTVAQIIAAFDSYTKGEINITYERYNFNKCDQAEGESFDDFYAKLRVLVKTCDFDTMLDSLLRDRIVLGIRDSDTRQDLLKERQLTLTDCVSMCRAAESARAHTSALGTTTAVHAVRREKRMTAPSAECRFCGRQHEFKKESCPAFGKSCSKCGRQNHFAVKCRGRQMQQEEPQRHNTPFRRQRPKNQPVQHINDDSTDDRPTDLPSDDDDWVYSVSRTAPRDAKCSLLVGRRPVTFQIDTGSSVNLLPVEHASNVRPYPGLLTTWDKSVVRPMGKCDMRVINPRNKQTSIIEFVVFDDPQCQPLLGFETSQSLGLVSINVNNFDQVHSIASSDQYKSLFDGALGRLPGEPHHLRVTADAVPSVMANRRVPIAVREPLRAELDRLVTDGVLVPVEEPTPWVSQLVVTTKRSGAIRVCVDPHNLNKVLQRERFSLPVLEDVLHELRDAAMFSKADLASGYWHVELDTESSLLTTFQTCYGRYRWLRLPFGTTVSSEVFQRRLLEALSGLAGVVCIADDIIIHGTDKQDHDKHLTAFLDRCMTAGIKLNRQKLEVGVDEVVFMGHRITKDGLQVDPEKVEAITNMTAPTNITELRRFIGMTNYLARFLPGLTDILQPLHNLLQHNVAFQWSSAQQEAFDKVKLSLTTAPVLQYYNPDRPLFLENDSSEYGIGSVISQDGKPVAYASRSLSDAERRYAQIEKEMLSVVFGLKKFHHYTYGRDVVVTTDHKPLVAIKAKPLSKAPRRLQQMLLTAQEYTYTLEFKPGKDIPVADALSRAPTGSPPKGQPVNNVSLTGLDEDRLDRIRGATTQDSTLQGLARTILAGWPNERRDVEPDLLPYFPFRDELTIHDGVVFRGERIVVPSSLRADMKQKLHHGHLGINSCLRRARELIYWPQMSSEIRQYIETCGTCATFGTKQPAETPITTETTTLPWTKVGVDLFNWSGKEYLVTTDYYSGYFEIDYLTDTSSNTVIGKLKNQFSRHGIPQVVVSDNGPQFSAEVFRKFASQWQFRHHTSSPYHSQGNGAAEAAVKTAKRLFRKCHAAGEDPYMGLLNLRNTPDANHQLSPVQRLCGRRTRTLLPTTENNLKPPSLHIKHVPKERIDPGTSRDLRRLNVGDTVRIQPAQGREWKEATVTNQTHQRSFEVTTNKGQRYRRNRRHLRLSKTSEHHQTPDETLNSNPTVRQPPLPAQPDHATPPVPCPSPPPKPPTPSPVTPARTRSPARTPAPGPVPVHTRSGRLVKPVARMDM